MAWAPAGGIGQIVETELQKVLTRLGFAPRLFEQTGHIGQSERDANTGKRAPLRHLVHQNSRGVSGNDGES